MGNGQFWFVSTALSNSRITGQNQAHQEFLQCTLTMHSLGPALVRVSRLLCTDPNRHSFQNVAYSTFPSDSSVRGKLKKKSWYNHGKESLSLTFPWNGNTWAAKHYLCQKEWNSSLLHSAEEGTRQQSHIIKSCAQTGTGARPLVPWSHFLS